MLSLLLRRTPAGSLLASVTHPRWLIGWLAVVAGAALVTWAAYAIAAAPRHLHWWQRVERGLLGERPPTDRGAVSAMAGALCRQQMAGAPFRLLVGMSVGLPVCTYYVLYAAWAAGRLPDLSGALPALALAQVVVPLLLLPAWAHGALSRSLREGLLRDLLAVGSGTEVAAAIVRAEMLLAAVAILAPMPFTLVASLAAPAGVPGALRVQALLLLVAWASVTEGLATGGLRRDGRLIERFPLAWLAFLTANMASLKHPLPLSNWVAGVGPPYALWQAATGGPEWSVCAGCCLFLLPDACRRFLRGAGATEDAAVGGDEERPPASGDPPWLVPTLLRRHRVSAGGPRPNLYPNPMADIEALPRWGLAQGALPALFWGLVVPVLLIVGCCRRSQPYWAGMVAGGLCLVLALAVVRAAISLSRERSFRTLDALALTPLRPAAILGAKAAAALRPERHLRRTLLLLTAVCAAGHGLSRPAALVVAVAILLLPRAMASLALLATLSWRGETLAAALALLSAPTGLALSLSAVGAPVGLALSALSPPWAAYAALDARPGALPQMAMCVGVWIAAGLLARALAVRRLCRPMPI